MKRSEDLRKDVHHVLWAIHEQLWRPISLRLKIRNIRFSIQRHFRLKDCDKGKHVFIKSWFTEDIRCKYCHAWSGMDYPPEKWSDRDFIEAIDFGLDQAQRFLNSDDEWTRSYLHHLEFARKYAELFGLMDDGLKKLDIKNQQEARDFIALLKKKNDVLMSLETKV